MTTVLCITGMHRSGTSLTASWIESCGLNIHDSNLIGPARSNPKGHFEDQGFVDLHSSAMLFENPKSNNWKYSASTFLAFTDNQLAIARTLTHERNKKFNMWGWKDPRSVMFLMQWKEVIPAMRVLLVWRPCSQVVDSLIKRSRRRKGKIDKINLLESVKLWKCYNARVCEYKRKFPDDTLLFNIDYIINHDRNVLGLINERFRLDMKYQPISALHDPKLLHKNPGLVARLASAYYGSAILEESLRDLSN